MAQTLAGIMFVKVHRESVCTERFATQEQADARVKYVTGIMPLVFVRQYFSNIIANPYVVQFIIVEVVN
jgi:hypothetical protein